MIKSYFTKAFMKGILPLLFFMLSAQISFAQTITTNTQGTHDGFFYSFWTERANDGASMTLGPAGNYSTRWSNTLNFTAGKGWKTGSADKVVCYEGTYDGGSNGFLALYGWTKDPLIEYYVCEKHGQWEPPGNTSGVSYKGTYNCDGGTYKVYTGRRENKPSIIGNASFDQYWSVRTQQRSSGTITFADHMAAWASFGMRMGTTWDYMIMESEGYNSSGSSNITLWECKSSDIEVEITSPKASETFLAPASITLSANASSPSSSISKVVFYNGSTKLGEDASAPYSYTWNDVPKGSYTITAVASNNKGEEETSTAVVVKVNMAQGPYGGTPHPIPGIIQFEEYDEGGNGSSYYDTDLGTNVDPAPNYRKDEDVDIENCEDTGGGYNLGWTVVDEWTEYTVNVQTAGTYTMELRIATDGAGKTLSIESDGKSIATNISIPNTGGWQTWETVSKDVELQAGEQVLRFTIGGADYINMNYVKFSIEQNDLCPNDPNKIEPGECGCGVADVDSDKDGTMDCNDECPNDPDKTVPGECGCGVAEGTCSQNNEKIQLYKGWNLIGYPNEGSEDIQVALSSVWEYVTTVKDLDVFYSKSVADTFNILKTLHWGMGYYIEVNQDCELEW